MSVVVEKKSVEELRKKASKTPLSHEEIYHLSRKWLEPTLKEFVESKLKKGVDLKKFPIDELSNLLGEKIIDHWIYNTQDAVRLVVMINLGNSIWIRNTVECEAKAEPVKVRDILGIKITAKATSDTNVKVFCESFVTRHQDILRST